MNLFGTAFLLDGVPLDGLVLNEAVTITDRGGAELTGTLADGSAFGFVVSEDLMSLDFFDADAALTVTLVSTAVILGDIDQDGDVTFSDIPSFIAALQSGTFLAQADVNQDGEVTFADIPGFIAILQAS